MTETDGIEEALEAQLRIAITVAGQLGEGLARARENALHRAHAAGEPEVRELDARLYAERTAARAELAGVRRDGWWENATSDQIAHAWQVARAWAADDLDAREAVSQLREQIRTRYGIDVDNAGANAADVERARAAAEEAEAALLMQQADAEERRAEQGGEDDTRARTTAAVGRHSADLIYDSADRRQHLAHDLEVRGVPRSVVETHVRADVSQATPPRTAARDGGFTEPKRVLRRGLASTRRTELKR